MLLFSRRIEIRKSTNANVFMFLACGSRAFDRQTYR